MDGGLVAFAVFAAVVTVTPGLDMMLVLRTAAVSGRRPGLAAVAGIQLGCLVWAGASALGVTAVLTASQLAYDVLRGAGAVYLCWLGARALWRARKPASPDLPVDESAVDDRRGVIAAFRTGLTTNLLNPKVGAFYLSVMPQFLPSGLAPLPGSLALGAIHVAEGVIWLSLLVAAVGRARGWVTRPSIKRRLEQISGAVFIAFGLRLAVER